MDLQKINFLKIDALHNFIVAYGPPAKKEKEKKLHNFIFW